MARLGVLKPLRGTESSLANVVLEDGEVAFSYPSTGPGTGLGGIKMGDGVKTFSSLPWYITGEGSGPTPDPWEYNTGTDEAALLNNIQHPEYETIGKIYYIQAYYHNSSTKYTESAPIISQDMPYMVIGINREGTSNTVDLISRVAAHYLKWTNSASSGWISGKYTTSNIYNWISDTCPNGYRGIIQAKMCYMTERWGEATGKLSGTMQSRQTKCKIVNPVESFGSAAKTHTFSVNHYFDGSYYRTDFDSKYGTIYPVWGESTSELSNRIIYHNKNMTTASHCWSNSWLGQDSDTSSNAFDFYSAGEEGSIGYGYVNDYRAIAPVIRLSDNPS